MGITFVPEIPTEIGQTTAIDIFSGSALLQAWQGKHALLESS